MKKPGRIGRFFFVHSRRSRVVHLSNHITEGYRTVCGVLIPEPGKWVWARTRSAAQSARGHLCRRCLKAAPPIIVARVRR